MRRIKRDPLAYETAAALQAFQAAVQLLVDDVTFHAGRHWSSKQNSIHIQAVVAVLKQMVGGRERCMYCVDSAATDIEHFWPKSKHPLRMFAWENLLLACTQCGRYKGDQFPLDDRGVPILIDPTVEDPWDYIDFDPMTGSLSARFLMPQGVFSERGVMTVQVLHLDRRQGVARGYLRTYQDICGLITGWSENGIPEDYLSQLGGADDHGLLGWFLRGAGSREPAVARFREQYGNVWAECARVFL